MAHIEGLDNKFLVVERQNNGSFYVAIQWGSKVEAEMIIPKEKMKGFNKL